MNPQYEKKRYNYGLGYRMLHVKGSHAGDSTLTYLHYSLSCMLIYFKSGEGVIKIEGRTYKLHAGDIVLLNPTEIFRFSVDDNIPHERLTINIDETMFDSFGEIHKELFSPFHNREKGAGNVIRAEKSRELGLDIYLDKILEYAESQEQTAPLMIFCKLTEFLSSLKDISAADQSENQVPLNPLVESVLEYLNIHFKEELSISSVAEKFNIDKSYLSHLFKEHTGVSLWTYVIYRRIQVFNTMLLQGGTAEENCYKVGFQNYSNFYRLYKKHMGVSPSQLKKETKTSFRTI